MEKSKNIIDHLSDFGEGVYDTFFVTPYNFGDFLARISGLRDWQNGSVVGKDYYRQEAMEEAKLFWRGITSVNSWDRAKILFNLAKNEIKNRPMYYLGSFGASGLMSSAIKTGSKAGDIVARGTFTTTMTSTKILANIHEFYPSFKTLNNNICSLYSNNKNYTNLFNQDMIMCSFLQNDNQESASQPQNLQQEIQKFYYNIQKTNTEFNSYKPISIISFTNPKVAYIQKVNFKDIQSLTPNSPLHLLKALYFCEDYIFLDSNQEPLLKESNWKEFYNYKDDFYIIFISQKNTLTQEYIDERITLYKAIINIRKEKQDKELRELQQQQESIEQELQGLDSKQRETKLKELQNQQEKQARNKQRQEQKQARFNKDIINTNYLILHNDDENIKVAFLKSHSNNDLVFKISFSNLIVKNENKVTIFAKDGTLLNAKENEKILGLVSDNTPAQIYFGNLKIEGGDEDTNNAGWFYGRSGETYSVDSKGNINIYYNDMCMKLDNCYHEAYDCVEE
ncbi:hypothetical protein T36_0488 [Helicobacter cinaedi]|uniref:hypothetical protein n=1 Tax=Helicobacter TaxID=209 RepID=UPI001F25B6A7|nr:hypothetical protein [Helicobacter cinaedi]BDB64041.1 hypothetical protein T36_0488 [Helicobacter cinaedi]